MNLPLYVCFVWGQTTHRSGGGVTPEALSLASSQAGSDPTPLRQAQLRRPAQTTVLPPPLITFKVVIDGPRLPALVPHQSPDWLEPPFKAFAKTCPPPHRS
ncbi:hypothetical protein AAFF_G00078780 [Aldrovandia affinis]|uniref:Uncharacterized protein n=1 Tax=Aldrovandia affinis TaxID=143900 RepID=A0AAD7RXD8_9TELE|nr:hypothetical protein AAFF_G00078780 [Aldrovandia affinis]